MSDDRARDAGDQSRPPSKRDHRDQSDPNAHSADWIPDEAIESLKMERSMNPSETEEDLARRLFREILPAAVASISNLAVHALNDRVRLDAAKYVVERNLGKIGDDRNVPTVDPWDDLLAACVIDNHAPYKE